MTEYIWVFVATMGGAELCTEAYLSAESANRRYREYAREVGVPYNRRERHYDWSGSRYNAWTSRVEVQP